MSDIQLLYTSSAVQTVTASDLQELAQQSGPANAEKHLSGVLLYGGGRFLQLLEGEEDVVRELYYEHIVKDPRHECCCVLMIRPCESRLFPDWNMGGLYMQQTEGAAQNAWDELCNEIARQSPAAVFSRDPLINYINDFIELFGSKFGQTSRAVVAA